MVHRSTKIHLPRSGVSVEDVKDTLSNPLKVGNQTKRKNSRGEEIVGQKFIGEKATVSINPETGVLIQCNPTESNLAER